MAILYRYNQKICDFIINLIIRTESNKPNHTKGSDKNMIIKLTFKDNDFTPLLENYTNKIFDIGYYNSINEYSEFKRKIYKYESDNLSEKEKQQLKKQIENQLIINCRKYISSHKKAEYLIKSLEIKIVETITDKWQNNEVVYYITSNLKYLVM